MKLTSRKLLQMALLVILLSAAGCAQATPTPEPTIDPAVIASTVSAIQTQAVFSAMQTMTQEAFLNPSATPTTAPTNTPEPTATNTPTAIPTAIPVLPTSTIVLPTLTPTQSAYQCSITSLTPASGTKLDNGADFDFKVTLKNTGKNTWNSSDTDFVFQSGAELQKKVDILDLGSDVEPGKEVTFIVDMVADTGTGTQTSTWALKGGGTTFCKVTISINVQD